MAWQIGNETQSWHLEAKSGLSLIFSQVPAGQFIDLYVSVGAADLLCWQCMITALPMMLRGMLTCL